MALKEYIKTLKTNEHSGQTATVIQLYYTICAHKSSHKGQAKYEYIYINICLYIWSALPLICNV